MVRRGRSPKCLAMSDSCLSESFSVCQYLSVSVRVCQCVCLSEFYPHQLAVVRGGRSLPHLGCQEIREAFAVEPCYDDGHCDDNFVTMMVIIMINKMIVMNMRMVLMMMIPWM